MKKLLILLALFTLPTILQAQPAAPSLLRNGDFSHGSDNWQGDGKVTPGTKALVVTLDPKKWTRVYQNFLASKNTRYTINVTYQLSAGFAPSKNPGDYIQISRQLNLPDFDKFRSIAVQPGQFYGTIGDPNATSISMEVFNPKLGTTEVQNYVHTYPPVGPAQTHWAVLAFPPGQGTITLQSVSVTN